MPKKNMPTAAVVEETYQAGAGDAISRKVKSEITNQVVTVAADLEGIEAQRQAAVQAVACRVKRLIDPDAFMSDVFALVAEGYQPKTQPSLFGGDIIDASIVELEPQAQPMSVADFLALGSGSSVQPLAIEGGQDEG